MHLYYYAADVRLLLCSVNCLDHGMALGACIIKEAEGRRDPHCAFYCNREAAPQTIFYDFACGLAEYSLNREGHYFLSSRLVSGVLFPPISTTTYYYYTYPPSSAACATDRFHMDQFHSAGHTACSIGFIPRRRRSVKDKNDSGGEQTNSYLDNKKHHFQAMGQKRFCFSVECGLKQFNLRKRASHEHVVNEWRNTRRPSVVARVDGGDAGSGNGDNGGDALGDGAVSRDEGDEVGGDDVYSMMMMLAVASEGGGGEVVVGEETGPDRCCSGSRDALLRDERRAEDVLLGDGRPRRSAGHEVVSRDEGDDEEEVVGYNDELLRVEREVAGRTSRGALRDERVDIGDGRPRRRSAAGRRDEEGDEEEVGGDDDELLQVEREEVASRTSRGALRDERVNFGDGRPRRRSAAGRRDEGDEEEVGGGDEDDELLREVEPEVVGRRTRGGALRDERGVDFGDGRPRQSAGPGADAADLSGACVGMWGDGEEMRLVVSALAWRSLSELIVADSTGTRNQLLLFLPEVKRISMRGDGSCFFR